MDHMNSNGMTTLGSRELQTIRGGWWRTALGILYTEVKDVWDSGGNNLVEAYKQGYEAGR